MFPRHPLLCRPFLFLSCTAGTLSPEATRRLTLIAKVLQNVSNGVLFSAKEEFMVPLNPFLEYNFKLVRDFIDDFVVRTA